MKILNAGKPVLLQCCYQGETEDEIMRKAREHAAIEHNMKSEDMTSEMQQKIRGLIRSS